MCVGVQNVISKTLQICWRGKRKRRGNGLHTCVVQGRGENRGGILRFPQFMNCFLTQRKKPRKKEEKKEEKRVHTQQWAKEVMLLLVFPRKVAALLEWTSTPARMNFMLCAAQRGIAQDHARTQVFNIAQWTKAVIVGYALFLLSSSSSLFSPCTTKLCAHPTQLSMNQAIIVVVYLFFKTRS